MDKVFLVANLKSYKTQSEAKEWLKSFINIDKTLLESKEVIICPSFTLLEVFKSYFTQNNLDIKLGAQNVSPFDEGPYTGEINARQIKDFADFVLIGHSERRNNFGETDEMLSKKVDVSLRSDLKPIFLVQNSNVLIPQGVELIAYEPVFAIGSGNPDTSENVDATAAAIRQKGEYKVLYGGSVTSTNIKDFTSKSNINGALIGGASLDAKEFIKIIQNA